MNTVLRKGSRGQDVAKLQTILTKKGFRPGKADGVFGSATHAAVIAFQRSEGLLADGIVGPKTWKALGQDDHKERPTGPLPFVTNDIVGEMFPFTSLSTISQNLPIVLQSLKAFELDEKPMILVALGTIRAETETFEPVSEHPSRYNSSPDGHPFDLYDYRRDLGNRGAPDGATFKGRGFIQLTGRANYGAVGKFIGLGNQLLRQPDQANEPKIAADILAAFLSMRRMAIKRAVVEGEWRQVRRLVNGGSHGLERFLDAVRIGDELIPDEVWPAGNLKEPLMRTLPAPVWAQT